MNVCKSFRKTVTLLSLLLPLLSAAQTLTLQQACDSARLHYPAIRQKQLVQQTAALSIDNLSKGYLPQVSINGQATYQSDVTKIAISFPGVNIEPLSKDQYKLAADISQVIYDGGMIRQQQQLQQLNAKVEDQKLEVELYKLKERVTQVYLGILYIDEQLKQSDLIKNDIDIGIKKVQAQVDNGVAFRSNISLIKAERIKADQRSIELTASRKGLMDVLSLFLQQSLPYSTQLVKPEVQLATNEDIQRPELQLYSSQNLLLAEQTQLIKSKNLPKASAFVQGGYGRPGLNMLKNAFEPYGIGGLRLNWSLSNLYTAKKEKQQVNISRQAVDLQKETFLLNTQTQYKQQQAEIDKLQQLMVTDNEIISLRNEVKKAATVQLENGVITTNDYLKEVNAEDQARQTRITHQVQLLQALVNLQIITGK
jgi:outer membrane protein TolC